MRKNHTRIVGEPRVVLGGQSGGNETQMTKSPRFPWWIGLVLLAGCGALGGLSLAPRQGLPVAARAPEERGVLRVVTVQALSPDPHRRTMPLSTYNHFALSVWEPLVECDPATGTPMPAAAESWAWSDDQRVLTLKLRPEARWSNGDPVTAADFVRGWLRLLRQGIEVAHTLFPVQHAEAYHRGDRRDPSAVGFKAIDAHTLQLRLAHPRVTLVAELADPLLVPLHASNEATFAEKTYLRDPAALVTNGPFRFAGVAGDRIKLRASAHYHAAASVTLRGVEFLRTNSLSAGAMLVAAGKADLLAPMGSFSPAAWPTVRPVNFESELALGVTAIFFNTARGPLQDPRVRQALALALDRDLLIGDTARDRVVPAFSWVPDMPGRKGLNLFEEDAASARRLLAEAGYAGGVGLPILRMCLPSWVDGSPYPLRCAEQWFQQLGVRVYVAYDSPEARRERLNAGDYDITFGGLIATVPDAGDLLGTFLMPELYRETKWNDPETVRMLTTANQKTGAERLQWLELAECRAMGAVPVVPLIFERRVNLRAAEVQGWYPDPLARQSFKRLSLRPSRSPQMGREAIAFR